MSIYDFCWYTVCIICGLGAATWIMDKLPDGKIIDIDKHRKANTKYKYYPVYSNAKYPLMKEEECRYMIRSNDDFLIPIASFEPFYMKPDSRRKTQEKCDSCNVGAFLYSEKTKDWPIDEKTLRLYGFRECIRKDGYYWCGGHFTRFNTGSLCAYCVQTLIIEYLLPKLLLLREFNLHPDNKPQIACRLNDFYIEGLFIREQNRAIRGWDEHYKTLPQCSVD